MSELFDVIEVSTKAPHRVRVLETNKTERNAEAVVNFAVLRRGCDAHFFTVVPAGKYHDGDTMLEESP